MFTVGDSPPPPALPMKADSGTGRVSPNSGTQHGIGRDAGQRIRLTFSGAMLSTTTTPENGKASPQER